MGYQDYIEIVRIAASVFHDVASILVAWLMSRYSNASQRG